MANINSARQRKLRKLIPGYNSAELKEYNSLGDSVPLLDLASNDYLGLNRHPKIIEAAYKVMQANGVGSGASRLVTGNRPIHQELEDALADWLGHKRALVFPSGYQANIAAISALANRHTTVLADRLIHNSLLVGVKVSGAKLKRFKHNDINDLEESLLLIQKEHTQPRPLVVTESLFSMEGTSPPLKKIAKLCEQYGAKLLVDEAHALGIIGNKGKGLCYGMNEKITMISGTFGKAFGGGGAFLASNQEMHEHLIQTSGAFRYTTALAPPLSGAALAALELIKANPEWGLEIQKQAQHWRLLMEQAGLPKPAGSAQILSVLLGEDEQALNIQNQLEKAGFLTVAIRPPTVPEGTSRLRIIVRKGLPSDTGSKLLKAWKAI